MGLPRDGTGGEDSARTACGGTPQPRHASRPPRNPARPYPYYTQFDRLAGAGMAASLGAFALLPTPPHTLSRQKNKMKKFLLVPALVAVVTLGQTAHAGLTVYTQPFSIGSNSSLSDAFGFKTSSSADSWTLNNFQMQFMVWDSAYNLAAQALTMSLYQDGCRLGLLMALVLLPAMRRRGHSLLRLTPISQRCPRSLRRSPCSG
jgi:hypothetical protein